MIRFLLLALISLVSVTQVSAYNEVSCSQYWSSANGCDQCFDGGSKYEWDSWQVWDYMKTKNTDVIYFPHENSSNYTFQSLNSGTSWFVSNNLLEYPSNLTWYTQSSTGNNYLHFPKNTNTLFLDTKSGKGIKFQSTANDNIDPTEPAFKFTFVSKHRLFSGGNLGNVTTHKECVFYKPNYCGDGILQTNKGETCDPNDPSETGHGNGGCNTNTCTPIENPVCKSLTVNKTSGENPVNVEATCTGYKVNTFTIDCGNGQTFTGNGSNSGEQTFKRTCNYTSAGTFTPTCKINGSITSNSCEKTVTVTDPKVPSIVVDKRDSNSADLDGITGTNDSQTIYKGETSSFKIRVTNNGEEALKNIKLTDAKEQSCATKQGGTVNLSGKNFTNVNNQTVEIYYGGAGSHTNNTLEVGEWFEYYCAKSNTTAKYTNTVITSGVGVTSGTLVDDSDPTTILVIELPKPEITIVKRDANTNDLDGSIGWNDSQTVQTWKEAVFHITVTNTGEEDLKDIKLDDPQALACSSAGNVNLSNKYFTNSESYKVDITVTWAGNHSDDILQVGESFYYTCAKYNTQSAYTNTVFVEGTGVTSGEEAEDADSTRVLTVNPAISVDKQDSNSADLDGEPFNDTQTVVKGERATFYIKVRNTGSEDLINIELEDDIAPACASNWIVNLSSSRFTNEEGNQVVIHFDGAWNHSDNVLSVNEEFTYTCSKLNTQNNYDNVVEVEGEWEESGLQVDDEDDTEVLVNEVVYDVALRKEVSDDLFCLLLGVCPSYTRWDDITFTITLENQGNVDATVEVIDYIPTGLTLKDNNWSEDNGIAYYNNSISIEARSFAYIDITFEINEDAPSTISNYAEISNDDGDDCDSNPDSTVGNDELINNRINPGCDDEDDEDDHDIETISIVDAPIYDLALTKVLSNATNNYKRGDEVMFEIEIHNQGTVPAVNYEITEYVPEWLLPFVKEQWWIVSQDQTIMTFTENDENKAIAPGWSRVIEVYFRIEEDAPDVIENYAEISDDDGDDCDSTPDDANGNQDGETFETGMIDDEIGGRCDETGTDEDDHDIAVLTLENTDVVLIKELKEGQSSVVEPGDRVDYVLTVKNNSDQEATNLIVEDHFPAELSLADTDWTLHPTKTRVVVYNTEIASLAAGAELPIEISFTVNEGASGNILNLAIVCDADEVDGECPEPEVCDPETEDCCDEDDENYDKDGCEQIVVLNPSIKIDKTDANDDLDQDGSIWNDSQKVNKWDKAVFKIRVTNDGDEDLDTIVLIDDQAAACEWSVTLPETFPNTWSDVVKWGWNTTDSILEPGEYFEYTCEKSNTQSDYTNIASVEAVGVESEKEVDDSDDSSVDVPGGSSGWTPECKDIVKDGSDVTCFGNGHVGSFMMQCGTWEDATYDFANATKDPETGRYHAEFSCAQEYAQCRVHGSKNQTEVFGPSWYAVSSVCQVSTNPPECWNGVLEAWEECDSGTANGTSSSLCSNSCDLDWSNPNPSCEDDDSCPSVISWPAGWEVAFGPQKSIVIGHGKNVFEAAESFPYMTNTTFEDVRVHALCIKEVNDDDSIYTTYTGKEICIEVQNEILYGWEDLYMIQERVGASWVDKVVTSYRLNDLIATDSVRYPRFEWDKEGIWARDFGEGKVVIAYKMRPTDLYQYNTYFAAHLDIKVAKPTISTVGWGTSYVKTSDTGDVAKVTADVDGFTDGENTNFVWVSVSNETETISSEAEEVNNTNTEVIEETIEQQETIEEKEDIIDEASINGTLTSYNGLDNVYAVSGNYTLTASDIQDIDNLTEARTYIIQGGDLIIESDIVSDKNVAFVVRGWDIIVASSVSRIDGTYIAFEDEDGNKWDFIAQDSTSTGNQLVVNGTLYGDVSDLVDNRYYIAQEDGQLSVGTIVSFGSGLFTNPAPLVSDFVGQYLESSKVSK